MQRPIILVVTENQELEGILREAVLDSFHAMRQVRNLRNLFTVLGDGGRSIAMAIVDLDHYGVSLLRMLGACEVDFPILAITSSSEVESQTAVFGRVSIEYLPKKNLENELKNKIRMMCSSGDLSYEDHNIESAQWDCPTAPKGESLAFAG